jgi:prolyl-tRNA editing enzyme YbaK/EbsC (Cys-tRNA(Pro) deacylase)
MHKGTGAVAAALAVLAPGVEIRELSASTRTAADAAAALGCALGAIANSLVFMAGDQPVLILTSGAHRVDTELVATAIGAPSLRQATPDEVRAATGQPIGGVAPVGHPAPLRTLIDRALERYPVIWAAAGTPHAVFPTTCAELLAMTGGSIATVAP